MDPIFRAHAGSLESEHRDWEAVEPKLGAGRLRRGVEGAMRGDSTGLMAAEDRAFVDDYRRQMFPARSDRHEKDVQADLPHFQSHVLGDSHSEREKLTKKFAQNRVTSDPTGAPRHTTRKTGALSRDALSNHSRAHRGSRPTTDRPSGTSGRVQGPPRKVKYLALTGALATIVIFGALEAHSIGKERKAVASAEASAKFWTPDHTIAGIGKTNTPGLKAE